MIIVDIGYANVHMFEKYMNLPKKGFTSRISTRDNTEWSDSGTFPWDRYFLTAIYQVRNYAYGYVGMMPTKLGEYTDKNGNLVTVTKTNDLYDIRGRNIYISTSSS